MRASATGRAPKRSGSAAGLSVERALDGGDTEKARRPIEHLSYFATDELDYETELASAVAAYLQVVDPGS